MHVLRQYLRGSSPSGLRPGSVLLALYMISVAEPGALHHHAAPPDGDPRPGYTSHTCGADERHIPLDHLGGCGTCLLLSHRWAALPRPFTFPFPPTLLVCSITLTADRTIIVDLLASGVRGPPLG
jgi:hypothetical protein